ncbi:MBL fold metallo-hydrolase [Methanoplanus sp. FWC-SCC4]|uniref:MBL fold metallo-hydrolase n=1 Tax=Methanochimaera problematica TaxID=2609417 RepID=A0AA97FCB0_9EURY|nr:MBL fold metallo-hydrolase [Methanoplanus sp. FWC-SCC4]WOF16855.1 MBL fold metallo-hydrolase [Methanoplanus sp. FWC-SCC4]
MTDHIIPVSWNIMNSVFVSSYIVSEEGTIVIDTGYPGSEHDILDKIAAVGKSPEDVDLIIVTHGHPDHAGSAFGLRSKTGAKVLMHHLDLNRVRSGHQGKLKPACLSGKLLASRFERENTIFPPFEPDILISASYSLEDFGVAGTVIPTPGHTQGSVSVVLKSGDAFVGDLIFPSMLSGRPHMPYWADNKKEVLKSVKKVLNYSPARIYGGHCGPFSAEDVRRNMRIK